MEYKINDESNWLKKINVIVDADQIQPKLDNLFKEYQKGVKIEGFRKGKVPMQLVKKMFGKQIETEAFQPHLQEAWKKVFEENEFDIIDEPRIENINYDQKAGLTFDICFDVRPDFKIEDYEGLAVEKEVFKVEDSDVDETIEELRQRNAMVYTVEGEAKEGHFLVADLQELDASGVPVVGTKMENRSVYLAKEDDELTTQLLGIKAGEERRVSVMLAPEKSEVVEQEQDNLDKVEHFFTVTVKEVKERRVPELDDEFAKDLGEFENMEQLKNQIHSNLILQAEAETKNRFNKKLADELIKKVDVGVPASMLNNYLNALVNDFVANQKDKKNINVEQVRDFYKPMAVRTIKWILIREKLIDQESLKVEDAELETRIKEIEETGDAGKKQAEEIRSDDEKSNDLKNNILEEKVYNFLESKTNISIVEKKLRQVEEANSESESDDLE